MLPYILFSRHASIHYQISHAILLHIFSLLRHYRIYYYAIDATPTLLNTPLFQPPPRCHAITLPLAFDCFFANTASHIERRQRFSHTRCRHAPCRHDTPARRYYEDYHFRFDAADYATLFFIDDVTILRRLSIIFSRARYAFMRMLFARCTRYKDRCFSLFVIIYAFCLRVSVTLPLPMPLLRQQRAYAVLKAVRSVRAYAVAAPHAYEAAMRCHHGALTTLFTRADAQPRRHAALRRRSAW